MLISSCRDEKGAYSSLCYQLGTNVREIHRVLGQTVLSETNTDSVVRTLKTIELLLDNVTYSKLSPGLLTNVSRVVKPYICHPELVVRANALSVFVYLLLVKPSVRETTELLYSYAAPTGDSSRKNNLPEENCANLDSLLYSTVSSDDMEEYYVQEDVNDLGSNLESCDLGDVKTEDAKTKRTTCSNNSRRSLVGWLIGQCVDNLLMNKSERRGIYVQVELQSLKLLNALISEHFNLVYRRLPVIQKIISEGCKENIVSKLAGQSNSNDCGVVVEHVYPVLGALLSLLKKETSLSSPSRANGNIDCTKTDSKTRIDVPKELNIEDVDWPQLSINVWIWALQDPLSELLMLPLTDEYISTSGHKSGDFHPSPNNIWWVQSLSGNGEESDVARRQLVASANVLTLLTHKVAESIGENLLNSILRTVLWLINHSHNELSVWGVRAGGVICSLEEVQRSILGEQLVKEAIDKATTLLLQQDETDTNDDCDAPVNKHRLVAVSALANIAATLKHYSSNKGDLMSVQLIEKLLETAILACKDKSRIRPHGVRCLGSCLGWLRDLTCNSQRNVYCDRICPEVYSRALTMLITCCSTGSNMKMRWNACHALGHLLHSPLPINGSQEWRKPIMSMLCELVSGFHNYKVRIQACGALCCVPNRELYGEFYLVAWKSLVQAANSTQNVVDYLEMRHRDDLICQVSIKFI